MSWFGDSLYFVSLLWLVQEMTGSRAMMGLVAACRTFPALLSVVAGAFVDRWDRRRMMIATDLIRAATVALIPLFRALGILQPWQIPVVAFMLALTGAFFVPARQALLPATVERRQIAPANSLMTLSQQAIFVVGYATGGMLIAAFGVLPMFTIDSATFLVSVTAITAMKMSRAETHPGRVDRDRVAAQEAGGQAGQEGQTDRAGQAERRAGRSGLGRELGEGLRYVYSSPALRIIMPLSVGLNFVFAPVSVLMPSWVSDVLRGGPQVFGLIQTASMAGMAVGSVAAGVLVAKWRRSVVALSCLGAMGLLLVVFSMVRGVAAPLAAMAAMGMTNAVTNIILMTWLQTVVPQRMMGRVFGALGTVSQIAAPAGQALAGMLGEVVPLPLLFGGPGLVAAGAAAVYALVPPLRRAFDLDQAEEAVPGRQAREAAASGA